MLMRMASTELEAGFKLRAGDGEGAMSAFGEVSYASVQPCEVCWVAPLLGLAYTCRSEGLRTLAATMRATRSRFLCRASVRFLCRASVRVLCRL